MRPVVLVHGAWHGPWCWERVTAGLDAAGVPWIAPDLPSCTAAYDGAGLLEDARAVERALDELPGSDPAVLVGHSRGGLVISEAGTHDRVGHLVYLAAFLLEPGEDVGAMVRDTVMPVVDFDRSAGLLVATPRAGDAPAVFYNDCSAGDVAWAMERVRPMHMGGTSPDPPGVAWRTKPSTYVVCGIDAAIPPEHQRRMAGRAPEVVEWDTGHSPFLNAPELVVDLLVRAAG